jgi:hypothetical protein
MSAQPSWATEVPAVNHAASFEIEDTHPAKVSLDNKEFSGRGLPILSPSSTLRQN